MGQSAGALPVRKMASVQTFPGDIDYLRLAAEILNAPIEQLGAPGRRADQADLQLQRGPQYLVRQSRAQFARQTWRTGDDRLQNASTGRIQLGDQLGARRIRHPSQQPAKPGNAFDGSPTLRHQDRAPLSHVITSASPASLGAQDLMDITTAPQTSCCSIVSGARRRIVTR